MLGNIMNYESSIGPVLITNRKNAGRPPVSKHT